MAKWIARAILLLIILAVGFGALAYYLMSRSVPNYDLAEPLNYGDYRAEITRDFYGVPHIKGERDVDAMFALGFAHAQDRLWQMVETRRTTQGRLSQIYGEKTLQLDKFMRSLDLWRLSQAVQRQLPQSTRDRLNAYADGVNAYINEINTQSIGSGAPEFWAYSRQLAPWTAIDSIAISKLYALQMTAAAEYEIQNGQLTALLGPDGVAALGQSTTLLAPSHPDPELSRLSPTGYGRSAPSGTAFAADKTRTADRATIIGIAAANTLSAPSQWYLANMQWGVGISNQRATGATIPGLPIILNGHNGNLAWGLTPSTIDDQDIVILRVTGDGGRMIDTLSGTQKLQAEAIAIPIGDETSVEFTRLTSAYGPVIPLDDNSPWDLTGLVPEGHYAALAWPGLSASDQSIVGLFGLMEARNVAQAQPALAQLSIPVATVSLGDSTGAVANHVVGARPMRDPANPTSGASPTPSWLAPAGFATTETTPFAINETKNGLSMVTQNPLSASIAQHSADIYRHARATELLSARSVHTVSSFAEAQSDTIATDARAILPLIAGSFWYQPDQDELRAEALTLLGEWTGEFDALDPQPLIYTAWLRELNELIFGDELGANYPRFSQIDPARIERAFLNTDGAAAWCDIVPTPETETCVELADIALDRAINNLTNRYGTSTENWRWSRAHFVQNVHPGFADLPILGTFADIPHQYSGGATTLSTAPPRNSYAFDLNADQGDGFQMIVDFADLQRSKYIIATGQSGHFLSPHYDDQSALWRDGQYLDMITDGNSVSANRRGSIRFEP